VNTTTIDVTRGLFDGEPVLHILNGSGLYVIVPVTRGEFWGLVERFAAMFPQTLPTFTVDLKPEPIDTGSIVTVADDVWVP